MAAGASFLTVPISAHCNEGSLEFAYEILPASLQQCISGFSESSPIAAALNPFYLRGDFNGDTKPDHAFIVRSEEGRGIALCFGENSDPTIVGGPQEFQGMNDLNFDHWIVYSRGPVVRGVGEGEPPVLVGDGIYLVWSETASALLYWDGSSIRWYQQGD